MSRNVGNYLPVSKRREKITSHEKSEGNYHCLETSEGNYHCPKTSVMIYHCLETSGGNYHCPETSVMFYQSRNVGRKLPLSRNVGNDLPLSRNVGKELPVSTSVKNYHYSPCDNPDEPIYVLGCPILSANQLTDRRHVTQNRIGHRCFISPTDVSEMLRLQAAAN